jgi:hypothetical protein
MLTRPLQRFIAASQVFFPLLLLMCLLFLAVCGSSTSANGSTVSSATPLTSTDPTTGTPVTNAPSPVSNTGLLAILPSLQKSVQAMRQLKTVHVDVKGGGTIQTSGQMLPVFAATTPYSLYGTGDIDINKQEGKTHMTLKLRPPGGPETLIKDGARLLGGQLYLQAPTHQWFVLDPASVILKVHALGSMPQPQDVLALVQHITVTDQGRTTVAGHQTHHLTLTLDQHALGLFTNAVQQPQAKQALASIQTPAGLRIDLFLDQATSLLLSAQVKGSVRVGVDTLLKSLGQGSPPIAQDNQARTITVTFALTITLSKLNRPIPKVVAPPHATPIVLP